MNDKLEFSLLIRALALYGLDDLNFTHCSAIGDDGRMMITSRTATPFWCCRPEDIATVPGPTTAEPNGQWHFNKAIHDALPDRARVVLHTHSAASIAIGMTRQNGLTPISQNSTLFGSEFLGWRPYEVFEYDDTAARNCIAALGDRRMALLLAGHGTLTLGRTIGEAFEIAYNLERACQIELAALATRSELVDVPEAARRRGFEVWMRDGRPLGRGSWPALRDALAATPPTMVVRRVA